MAGRSFRQSSVFIQSRTIPLDARDPVEFSRTAARHRDTSPSALSAGDLYGNFSVPGLVGFFYHRLERGPEFRPPDVREYDDCALLWPGSCAKVAGGKNRKEIGLGGVRCSHSLEPGTDAAIRRPNHSVLGSRKLSRDRQKQFLCNARAGRDHIADVSFFQMDVYSIDRPKSQSPAVTFNQIKQVTIHVGSDPVPLPLPITGKCVAPPP